MSVCMVPKYSTSLHSLALHYPPLPVATAHAVNNLPCPSPAPYPALAPAAGLDLSFLTTYAGDSGRSSVRLASPVHSNGPVLDDEILADKEVQEAIRTQGSVTKAYDIVNVDRAALGRLAGAVAKPYGDSGGFGALALYTSSAASAVPAVG